MRRKRLSKLLSGSSLLCVLSLALTFANASEWKPPGYITVGVYQVGSQSYAAGTAMNAVIEEKTGVKLAALPTDQTMSRYVLLRDRKVNIHWLFCGDAWAGINGVLDLKPLGPQSIRTLWQPGIEYTGLATRGDSGIKSPSDLKGKKVAAYPTYPLIHLLIEGALAYANLTWKDVIPIPVSGTEPGRRAVMDGAADVAFYAPTHAAAFELAASFRGIHWLPFPNDTQQDKAAWDRFHKIINIYGPATATSGAGISKEKPVKIWWGRHVICGYDWTDENLIYWFSKQIHINYSGYKDKHALLKDCDIGHALESDSWIVPYHEGAIRYFKEIGQWTPTMEKKQKELLTKHPQRMTK